MRMSQLFGRTLREDPTDTDIESHKLLIRAGYIRPLGTGIYSYLHLARRSMTKIEKILREEMDLIGGQEITMPVVQPAEIWKDSGRWYQIGSEMGRFKDKNNHEMVLAMTHEEAACHLAHTEIQSYHDLPQIVYQIQTKWRDDPRPRAGLIRVREFTMKDSYSFAADQDGMEKQYESHFNAYLRIFQRCGLPVSSVLADTGMMGGSKSHEFMYTSPIGEDTIVMCRKCGYIANRQVAVFHKSESVFEPLLPVKLVETPGIKTIDQLCNFLNIPKSKTAKAVFYLASINNREENIEQLIFTIIRGDMSVNETKLSNSINATSIRPATDDEIKNVGAVPGYGSPIGLKEIFTVMDDQIIKSPNLVAGANKEGYHLINVNYGRDFHANVIADIASAENDFACINCGSKLITERCIEVGNIFQLGTRYSSALDCTFIDRDGIKMPIQMGSYGIGIGRLLACIAEEHHDDHGFIWPITVAPYTIHLVALKGGEDLCNTLYSKFNELGLDTLFDDRVLSPGVKFNDADLLGLPVRITVGERAVKTGNAELKLRHESEKSIISFEDIPPAVINISSALYRNLD